MYKDYSRFIASQTLCRITCIEDYSRFIASQTLYRITCIRIILGSLLLRRYVG